jgi:hypothetical protein
MADYEPKSDGTTLIRRIVGRNLVRSHSLGTPPAAVTIPFDKAQEMVQAHKRWDKDAKNLERLGQEVEEMLYDPNVEWDSKQKKLKRLVNAINTTILKVRHL